MISDWISSLRTTYSREHPFTNFIFTTKIKSVNKKMNSITFDMDNLTISGAWVNPKTGHRFEVRDCYWEDGIYKVQTKAGQVLDFAALENYVQENLQQ